MTARPTIACLGAGRMGRGIAVAFAYAGHTITMIDVKPRSAKPSGRLRRGARRSQQNAGQLGAVRIADRRRRQNRHRPRLGGASECMAAALAGAGIVFEGVPEVVDLSARCCRLPRNASGLTSSRLDHLGPFWSMTLSGAVENPRRFLNVHWLNPAYLIPLVEIAPGAATDPDVTVKVKALLEGIGKMPVVCAATPGFIVPRSRRSP